MAKKHDTPTAVRVARWTAVAAAITALGTVGNTFIEKRPWFLGGEDEKPKVVASAPKPPPPKMEHYTAPASIHFTIPSAESAEKSTSATISKASPSVGTMETAASVNVMAGAPDMGPWVNFLNFMEYRPIPFWTIVASILLLGGYGVIEFFHRREQKQKVMFDSAAQ